MKIIGPQPKPTLGAEKLWEQVQQSASASPPGDAGVF